MPYMLSAASEVTKVRWRTSARVSGARLYFVNGCLRPRKVSKDMKVYHCEPFPTSGCKSCTT